MSVIYEPRLRAERLIAGGRVALALASLFAVWFDVDEPVRFVALTYSVLVAYVLYALVVAAALWRVETVPRHWSVVAHATDLACCALLIFCTEGPSSPFNSLFVFALLSATLRWRARGTLWTAGIVMVAFLVSALYFAVVLAHPDVDLRALIIRGVYLLVLAALLHYVGTQDQRTLREMWGLAEWPHRLRDDLEGLTRDLLQYSATLMAAPRVALHWSEDDDTSLRQAMWNGGRWRCEVVRDPAPLVDAALGSRAFLRDRSGQIRTLAQNAGSAQLAPWQDATSTDRLSAHVGRAPVLCVPLRGENCAGHVLVLDKADATVDDLVLAEIVSDVIARRLDAFYLAERLRRAAATEERIRLARDLHDGVLQSFTGIALRLAAIQRLLPTDRSAALAAVEDLQRILVSEQRGLRFFIQELRPTPSSDVDNTPIEPRLRELARLMELEWDLDVVLTVDLGPAPSSALAREIYHLVREGLINAARHGSATAATVTITSVADQTIALTIADNGRGFPLTGHFTTHDLTSQTFGPKTLLERVAAIQGDLTLESSPQGATVRVRLPREAHA